MPWPLGRAPGVKRAIDVAGAGAALAAGALPLGLAAAAVRAAMGRPVLFRQPRPGRDGEVFTVTKLRTMRSTAGSASEPPSAAGGGERGGVPEEAAGPAHAPAASAGDDAAAAGDDATADQGADSLRLTRLGRFLRATSLDELPQLVQVLRGNMSLVGPRPLLVEYLPRYSAEQARRHEVRPGLTGLAQVSGRNELAWQERFELDVWYVDHWTVVLDLEILVRTVLRVLTGRGVRAQGVATMTPFTSEAQPPVHGEHPASVDIPTATKPSGAGAQPT